MTKIARLLKRLNEMDAIDDTPLNQQNQKEGYRLVSGDNVVWYTCPEDAQRRYRGGSLKTDRGVVRIITVSPVDDGSHNCNFCGAQLTPPENSQEQTNQGNLDSMGMGDLPGQGQPDGVGQGGMF